MFISVKKKKKFLPEGNKTWTYRIKKLAKIIDWIFQLWQNLLLALEKFTFVCTCVFIFQAKKLIVVIDYLNNQSYYKTKTELFWNMQKYAF